MSVFVKFPRDWSPVLFSGTWNRVQTNISFQPGKISITNVITIILLFLLSLYCNSFSICSGSLVGSAGASRRHFQFTDIVFTYLGAGGAALDSLWQNSVKVSPAKRIETFPPFAVILSRQQVFDNHLGCETRLQWCVQCRGEYSGGYDSQGAGRKG